MIRTPPLAGLFVVLWSASGALAQPFSINSFTVDGGGASSTTGGNFELSGTIGQPDAGVATGGDFNLVGGFWPVTTAATPLTGDCDADGDVDLDNVAAFAACASGPAGGPPEPPCACFDINLTDGVDLRDFAAIQNAFTG